MVPSGAVERVNKGTHKFMSKNVLIQVSELVFLACRVLDLFRLQTRALEFVPEGETSRTSTDTVTRQPICSYSVESCRRAEEEEEEDEESH